MAVMDMHLPDAPDGKAVDFVQSMGIPVVVLTGSVSPDLRQQMLDKDVLDYVVKQQATDIDYVARLVGYFARNRAATVLIVDDSKSFRLYFQQLLDRYMYKTLVAKMVLKH